MQGSNGSVVVLLLMAGIIVMVSTVHELRSRLALAFAAGRPMAREGMGGAGGGEGPAAGDLPPDAEDRRSELGLRRQIQELLVLIREFYTTCHMVAVGQLAPSQAKAKARDVEEQLNQMMSEMLERIEEMDS